MFILLFCLQGISFALSCPYPQYNHCGGCTCGSPDYGDLWNQPWSFTGPYGYYYNLVLRADCYEYKLSGSDAGQCINTFGCSYIVVGSSAYCNGGDGHLYVLENLVEGGPLSCTAATMPACNQWQTLQPPCNCGCAGVGVSDDPCTVPVENGAPCQVTCPVGSVFNRGHCYRNGFLCRASSCPSSCVTCSPYQCDSSCHNCPTGYTFNSAQCSCVGNKKYYGVSGDDQGRSSYKVDRGQIYKGFGGWSWK